MQPKPRGKPPKVVGAWAHKEKRESRQNGVCLTKREPEKQIRL